MLWTNFFKLTIFTTVPSSIYSIIVTQYNSYQEFRFSDAPLTPQRAQMWAQVEKQRKKEELEHAP
jgi:hypothetical protein